MRLHGFVYPTLSTWPRDRFEANRLETVLTSALERSGDGPPDGLLMMGNSAAASSG